MFENELADVKSRYAGLQSEYRMLARERDGIIADIQSTNGSIEILQETLIFLKSISTESRRIASREIENIVTNALQYVFGTMYQFRIRLNPTSTRPEADFVVVTTHGESSAESLPTLSNGGGITDLLSVSLKFALLELMKYDGPMWLDEPFKQISDEFIPSAGKLLTFMGDTSGRQINIITHNHKLVELCERVFKISQKNGRSQIALVTT